MHKFDTMLFLKMSATAMIPEKLQIGDLIFDSPLIQGPLAGYTCSAMRRLPWQFGGLAYTCTEMLSADCLAKQTDRSPRYHHVAEDEGPVCFQLSSHIPDILAKASERACAYGATLLDLNVGCPQPKIRKKKQGSAHLRDTQNLARCLSAMVEHSDCPVTVKIRVDGGSTEHYNAAALEAAHTAGVDAIIVHGRHWQEYYERAADWQQIAWFVDNADIPVIGNGDLCDADSCQRFFAETNAAGAMIARAAMGKPWLFQHILRPEHHKPVSLNKRIQLLLQHITQLSQLENSERKALLQARSFVKYYLCNDNEHVLHQLVFNSDNIQSLKIGVSNATTS